MSERTGRTLRSRQVYLADMHAVRTVQFTVSRQDIVIIEESPQCHGDVHTYRAVSFAEDKPVAFRVLYIIGINIHPVMLEADQNIRHREISPDMHHAFIGAAEIE